MSKHIGARQNSKLIVVSLVPSVNLTPMGNSVVPVPYPVIQKMNTSTLTSPNVFFNGDPVFTTKSNTVSVIGDAAGSAGGVKSGTVSAKSEAIP